MGFSERDLTCDEFLGGRIKAWQPRKGYRAATDPVLLAAAVAAKPGDHVLELGCGVGVASLCLAARISDLTLLGVERQAEYAELARRNGLETVTADLTALPSELRQRSFDHVIANPPYYPVAGGTVARDDGREQALREDTPVAAWVETAGKRLKPKGWLTMIHAADRLPDILRALGPDFGSTSVLPLSARPGRPAKRVLLRSRKSGRAPFALLSPLVIHSGEVHLADGDDFTPQLRDILRGGAAIPWG